MNEDIPSQPPPSYKESTENRSLEETQFQDAVKSNSNEHEGVYVQSNESEVSVIQSLKKMR